MNDAASAQKAAVGLLERPREVGHCFLILRHAPRASEVQFWPGQGIVTGRFVVSKCIHEFQVTCPEINLTERPYPYGNEQLPCRSYTSSLQDHCQS